MATINGTSANNSLYGTRYADTIRGYAGNDYVNGQGGNDTIDGGIGEDKVDGRAGNDTVRGGAGRDFVGGGTGNDLLYGDDGDDYLWGDVGFDQLFGGAGNDRMLAGEGTNDMSGGDGNDTLVLELYGLAGDDQSEYYGDAGFDTAHIISTGTIDINPYDEMDLAAEAIAIVQFRDTGTGYIGFTSDVWNETPSAPNTTVNASLNGVEAVTVDPRTMLLYDGSDVAMQVAGSDRNDVFFVGEGDETMAGGAGADSWRLMWHSHNHGTHNDDTLGHDRILDFRPVEGDMIETNGWTDYLSGEVILTAQHREVDGSTFYDSYDVAGDLIHTLEIVGVVGLAPDLLANEFIIMGPL